MKTDTACMAQKMGFKELFEHLGMHVCDLEQRWKLVMRVKRLLPDCNEIGGSGQDQCYFEGEWSLNCALIGGIGIRSYARSDWSYRDSFLRAI